MNASTISADIISFTSLSTKDKEQLTVKIQAFLSDLTEKYKSENFLGRNVQGDYIECAMSSPKYALRTALLLKTLVKSEVVSDSNDSRIRYFREYGVRIAIAVAPLNELNLEKGIIDGEAIYLSGRTIKNRTTSDKKKIVMKETMFFRSLVTEQQENFDAMICLLDTIISKCSQKQCEILYYKLSGLTEKEIGKKTGKKQSTISQHSSAASWNAIEKTVKYFENYIV
ncbi:MAG: RNA polymerase subunit sigma-70 [Bacteroidales bacterium]